MTQNSPFTYLQTCRHPHTEHTDVDQRDDGSGAKRKLSSPLPIWYNNPNSIDDDL